MAKRMNMPHRREQRRQDAAERAEKRAELSASQQIAILDKRLGKGKGATKERKRLSS